MCLRLWIFQPLRNTSKGEGGFLDFLHYCLIHIESVERGRRTQKR